MTSTSEKVRLEAFTKKRNLFLVEAITDYDQRLKNGEKKRILEREKANELVQKLGFEQPISHKDSGEPFLKCHPEMHLSISHSNGWVAVLIDTCPIGVDIEMHNPRILNGTSYFVNQDELKFETDIHSLHLIWSAKEAFYKRLGGAIDDLKNEVTLTQILDTTLEISYQNNHYLLDYIQFENKLTLVVC